MEAKKPVRREDVAPRRLGDECLLYDTREESIHVINSVAEFVWGLCDGAHAVDDMVRCIQEKYDVPDDANVCEDIEKILREFTAAGVLSEGNATAA